MFQLLGPLPWLGLWTPLADLCPLGPLLSTPLPAKIYQIIKSSTAVKTQFSSAAVF